MTSTQHDGSGRPRLEKKVNVITVRLIGIDIEELDILVDNQIYNSRSDLIRSGIKNIISLYGNPKNI